VAVEKDERVKQAMALHDEAWALYEDGRYQAAIERLEAALRIDPDGRELVYNLGLLHEKLGDLHDALAYYRRYADMEPDPKAKLRAEAMVRRIAGAEREAAARAAAASLLAPPPPPPGIGRVRRSWVIATAGLATAGFVTGVGFGLTALVRNPGSGARTGNGVTIASLQTDAHAAHTDAVVADIAFIVAAAAATTAALLYTTGTHRPRVLAVHALGGTLRSPLLALPSGQTLRAGALGVSF
jgi:tetratricopeptide (TPR) repeat protein